jgi:ABC-type Fe3+/spermidine/putrescine transport system ATPase subunit
LSGQDVSRPDGTAATVAIRPENLIVHSHQPGPGAVAGVVQARQYLGGRQMLHVAITGRPAPVAVAIQGPGEDSISGLSPSQDVWLTWKDDAILLLDA